MLSAASFLVGYFLCVVTQYVVPALADVVSADTLMSTTSVSTVGKIIWLGLIIVWVLALIVVPLAFAVWGITTPTERQSPILAGIGSILYFVFAILLTWAIYFWVTPLADSLIYNPLKAMFWVGLVGVWLINVIITPMMGIAEAKA